MGAPPLERTRLDARRRPRMADTAMVDDYPDMNMIEFEAATKHRVFGRKGSRNAQSGVPIAPAQKHFTFSRATLICVRHRRRRWRPGT